MTTTLDKAVLLEALGRAALTCGDGRTYPIMACALFGGGSVTTTTLETFTTVALPGLPTCAVDARRLLGIVRALDGDDVTLAVTGHDVTVTGGRAAYKLRGWNHDDFPAVPTCDVYGAVDGIDGALIDLAARLNTDRFGVQISFVGGQLALAATDGYRLVCNGSGADPVVISGRGMRALSGLTITGVGTDDNWVFFRGADSVVGVRRQGGSFPDVDHVVASAKASASGVAHIDGKRLREALGRVQLLAGDTGRVQLAFAGGRLKLSATSDGAGEAMDTVPYEGDAVLGTAVNGKYLADFVRFAGEYVEITVNGGVGSPLLLTTDGVPDTSYVLTPMR